MKMRDEECIGLIDLRRIRWLSSVRSDQSPRKIARGYRVPSSYYWQIRLR